MPQRLYGIPILSLRLPLHSRQRHTLHLRFLLQNAEGVRCLDTLKLTRISGEQNPRVFMLRQLKKSLHLTA